VIIPTYNDVSTLVKVVLNIKSAGYDVLVVNDGSTDGTDKILEQENINYISHKINLGQGAALRTGMEYATLNNYGIVVHFDSDGQHQVKDIDKLIQPVVQKECDITLGSRFLDNVSSSTMPFDKRVILKLSRYIEAMFTGILLSDAHNGFRALNYKAFSSIKITLPRMAHATQIIQEIRRLDLKYLEVPVEILYNKNKKDQSFIEAFIILYELIREKIKN
jgi:polyprenyl-phospho-N-acetylgalactosaminyl synthase